jgi:hypothetical protein
MAEPPRQLPRLRFVHLIASRLYSAPAENPMHMHNLPRARMEEDVGVRALDLERVRTHTYPHTCMYDHPFISPRTTHAPMVIYRIRS